MPSGQGEVSCDTLSWAELRTNRRTVRLQAFKAIDMFVKRTEQLVASMPETVLPAEDQQTQTSGTAVASQRGQPGIAESAGGAAVALAGWAFTSLSSRVRSIPRTLRID